MRVVYSDHAQQQMIRRSVTPSEVEAVIADPHEEYPGTGQSIVNVREVGGRRIKIYLVRLSSESVLVTTVAVRGE